MFYFVTFGGILFLIFGLSILITHLYYRVKGKETPGKVIAVERLIIVSSGRNGSHESTFYRPIYEYLFEGGTVWFTAGGSGSLDCEIDQQVTILALGLGPEYCRPKNNAYYLFSAVFIPFGIGAIAVGWSNLYDWIDRLIPMIFVIALFFINRQYLISKKRWRGLLRSSRLETFETLAGRDIYWGQERLEQEKASNAKRAVFARSIFFLLTSILTYFLWNKLPKAPQQLMLDKENLLLPGFAILLFLTLLSAYGLLRSILKIARR